MPPQFGRMPPFIPMLDCMPLDIGCVCIPPRPPCIPPCQGCCPQPPATCGEPPMLIGNFGVTGVGAGMNFALCSCCACCAKLIPGGGGGAGLKSML
mmetsp:Transcript_51019/g.91735  ORF Transcript_51019/g.91735 Transcript_51019/m.91735 type:complete len:96 (+) Transcript_51019:417-704(+)